MSFAELERQFYNQKIEPIQKPVMLSELNKGDYFYFYGSKFNYKYLGVENSLFFSKYLYTDEKNTFSSDVDREVFKTTP